MNKFEKIGFYGVIILLLIGFVVLFFNPQLKLDGFETGNDYYHDKNLQKQKIK